MGTSVATLDRSTGEIIEPHFIIADYLASLNSPAAFEHQRSLAAAYDAACHALIGPNDVQKAEGREFKKKSAWRKLARHFTISVACDPASARIDSLPDGEWIAVIGAVATAPWGQSFADVGACGSDEETGKRKISYADGIATAMTRAVNRAVSNLIAMGEVSAEEVGNRKPYPAASHSGGNGGSSGVPVMPFGKSKGTPLTALTRDDVEGAYQWAKSKGKFEEFQREALAELDARTAAPASRDDDDDREPLDGPDY